MDVTIVRLIWALAAVFALIGIIAYIVCALVIPDKPDDNVTVEN